jgi:hypothetical protein
VALGLLASPFEVSPPVSLLANLSFWGVVRKSGKDSNGDMTTVMFIATVLTLALAVGPSSGIILLPKLDWWPGATPLDRLSNNSTTSINTILLKTPFQGLHPTIIDSSFIDPACRLWQQNDTLTPAFDCPSGGLTQMIYNLPQVLGSSYIDQYTFNFSVNSKKYSRSTSLGWQFAPNQGAGSSVVYSTSPVDIITRELFTHEDSHWQQGQAQLRTMSQAVQYSVDTSVESDKMVNITSATSHLWLQPAVEVNCVELSSEGDQYNALFSEGSLASSQIGLESSLVETHLGIESLLGVSYVNIGKILPFRSSASFLSQTTNSTELCVVNAKWVESGVWLSKSLNNYPETDVSVDPFGTLDVAFTRDSNVIYISSDWVEVLNTTVAVADPVSGCSSAVPGLVALKSSCGGFVTSRCLSIGLFLFLTDSLSRLPYFWDIYGCRDSPLGSIQSVYCDRIWDRDEDDGIYLHQTDFPDFRQLLHIEVRVWLEGGHTINRVGDSHATFRPGGGSSIRTCVPKANVQGAVMVRCRRVGDSHHACSHIQPFTTGQRPAERERHWATPSICQRRRGGEIGDNFDGFGRKTAIGRPTETWCRNYMKRRSWENKGKQRVAGHPRRVS